MCKATSTEVKIKLDMLGFCLCKFLAMRPLAKNQEDQTLLKPAKDTKEVPQLKTVGIKDHIMKNR